MPSPWNCSTSAITSTRSRRRSIGPISGASRSGRSWGGSTVSCRPIWTLGSGCGSSWSNTSGYEPVRVQGAEGGGIVPCHRLQRPQGTERAGAARAPRGVRALWGGSADTGGPEAVSRAVCRAEPTGAASPVPCHPQCQGAADGGLADGAGGTADPGRTGLCRQSHRHVCPFRYGEQAPTPHQQPCGAGRAEDQRPVRGGAGAADPPADAGGGHDGGVPQGPGGCDDLPLFDGPSVPAAHGTSGVSEPNGAGDHPVLSAWDLSGGTIREGMGCVSGGRSGGPVGDPKGAGLDPGGSPII